MLRMSDGLKLALLRKETDRPTRLVEFRGRKRIAFTQGMDEVVSGMSLCILIDQICDLEMILV